MALMALNPDNFALCLHFEFFVNSGYAFSFLNVRQNMENAPSKGMSGV